MPPGWLPVQFRREGGEILLEWLFFGPGGLDDPFFERSTLRALEHPESRRRHLLTTRDTLAALDAAPPPDGLIFHMSRCGSTLVGRMLAAAERTTVISEAPLLDLAASLVRDRHEPDAMLGRIARALLRFRDPAQGGRGVIKLDAWHTLALPLFRRVFPDTPFVFLFRDPLEVLVSHQRRPGLHMVPGVLPAETTAVDPRSVAAEDYPAAVLGRIGRAALAHADDVGTIFVDYADLPEACLTRIAPHFGIRPDAAMRAVAGFDAKTPERRFVTDSAAKRAEAGAGIRASVDGELMDIHAALQRAAAS